MKVKRKRKAKVTRTSKHVVVGTFNPEHVAKIAEPVVVVALPKTIWERITDWLNRGM